MKVCAAAAMLLWLPRVAACQPPPGPAPDFRFSDADRKLLKHSVELDEQLTARDLVLQDPVLEQFLAELADPLLGTTPPPENVVWQFRVLRDTSVNAFALPNGSVYVTTGLLAELENEAQLCGVLAHEIAHVRHRDAYLHNRGHRRKMAVLNVAATVPIEALELPVPGVYLPVMAGVSQILLAAAVRGYATHVEHQADLVAVNRVLETGWDPIQVSKALRRLGGTREPRWIRSLYEDRAALDKRAAFTASVAEKAGVGGRTGAVQTYLAVVEKAIRYNIQADIDAGLFRTALAGAQKLANWRPQENEYRFWLAEAYRALGPRPAIATPAQLASERQHRDAARGLRRTPEEEEKEFLRTKAGTEAARANQNTAARLYGDILARDPRHARAHRGLGLLLQQQGDFVAAAGELRTYLRLEPGALDRLHIERRIEQLEAAR